MIIRRTTLLASLATVLLVAQESKTAEVPQTTLKAAAKKIAEEVAIELKAANASSVVVNAFTPTGFKGENLGIAKLVIDALRDIGVSVADIAPLTVSGKIFRIPKDPKLFVQGLKIKVEIILPDQTERDAIVVVENAEEGLVHADPGSREIESGPPPEGEDSRSRRPRTNPVTEDVPEACRFTTTDAICG